MLRTQRFGRLGAPLPAPAATRTVDQRRHRLPRHFTGGETSSTANTWIGNYGLTWNVAGICRP